MVLRISLLALLLAGCQFNGSVPDTAEFQCTGDGECPPSMVCQRSLSRCVVPMGPGPAQVTSARATLVPSANNLLDVVTAARSDTEVRVAIGLNQAVTCLRLRSMPGDVSFTGVDAGSANACAFAGEVTAMAVERDEALELDVRDSLGDEVTLAVTLAPALRVDTMAPAAADVNTAGRIEYVRAPFGSLETGGLIANRVTGAPGSVEAGATVRVLDLEANVEVFRTEATTAGAFGPVSIPPDPERVALMALDEAGNESPLATVRDITWVVNHRRRFANVASNNPHRVSVRPINASTSEPFFETEVGEETGIGRANDGLALGADGGVGLWQEVTSAAAPFPNGLVFDTRRARLLAITSTATNVWDGTTWSRVTDGPRMRGAILGVVYDSFRDLVVAVGDAGGGTTLAVWVFDGRAWSEASNAGPQFRGGFSLTFDAVSREVVLVGGGYSVDLGGFGSLLVDFSDVWVFDGLLWSRKGEGTVQAHTSLAGAFDPVRATHVMTGGPLDTSFSVFPVLPGDGDRSTLGWNGTMLSVLTDAGPPPREKHCLVWNPARRRVVMAGGESSYLPRRDLWEWDGTQWADVTPDGGLPAEFGAPCTYASTLGGIVFARSDLRVLRDDGGMAILSQLGTAAPERGAGAWSGDRLVFATRDGGTLTWAAGTWTPLDAGAHAITHLDVDPRTGAVFGLERVGSVVQLAVLDAGRWERLAGSVQVGSVAYTAFFDPDAGAFAVTTADAGWLYQGQWNLVGPGAPVGVAGITPPRAAPGLPGVVSISGVNSLLWSGGSSAQFDTQFPAQFTSDQYQVAGGSNGRALAFAEGLSFTTTRNGPRLWEPVLTLGPGPVRQYYDPYRFVTSFNAPSRRMWVHDTTARRTWQLALAELRPAVISRFALPAITSSTVSAMTITANAGGAGGARIRLWYQSGWADPSGGISSSNASATPSGVSLAVTDPAQVSSLMDGARDVTVALEPNDENGGSSAAVSVDYVQFALRYRLP